LLFDFYCLTPGWYAGIVLVVAILLIVLSEWWQQLVLLLLNDLEESLIIHENFGTMTLTLQFDLSIIFVTSLL